MDITKSEHCSIKWANKPLWPSSSINKQCRLLHDHQQMEEAEYQTCPAIREVRILNKTYFRNDENNGVVSIGP